MKKIIQLSRFCLGLTLNWFWIQIASITATTSEGVLTLPPILYLATSTFLIVNLTLFYLSCVQPSFQRTFVSWICSKRLSPHHITAAEVSKAAVRTEGTDSKFNRSCDLWQNFLRRVELDSDPFLDQIQLESRPKLIGAFENALREGSLATSVKNAWRNRQLRFPSGKWVRSSGQCHGWTLP